MNKQADQSTPSVTLRGRFAHCEIFPLCWPLCRFVRETGFRALASMCGVMAGDALRTDSAAMAEHLADGLCDSWSHVSCTSSRGLL